MARIKYADPAKLTPEIKDYFARMESHGAVIGNVWKMAANSPSTVIPLLMLGNALLTKTKLDPKLREIAILRTASILKCAYQTRSHTMFGKEVGVTDEQLASIGDWRNSAAFNETERALLSFVDEVVRDARATDQTFHELAKFMNDQMMTELVTLLGFYGTIARILLVLEVDLDDKPRTSSTQITGRPRK